MPFIDLLKKRDKLSAASPSGSTAEQPPMFPEITFMRSDTLTQEIITPPDFETPSSPHAASKDTHDSHHRFSSLLRSRPRTSSNNASSAFDTTKAEHPFSSKRLSQRMKLRKDTSSSNLPKNMPVIDKTLSPDGEVEGQWEQRATLLALENEKNRRRLGSPAADNAMGNQAEANPSRSASQTVVSSGRVDDNIQAAIRLHEAGNLEEATRMFGRLADPNGANNALSQILYGLALRHGWGCTADLEKAMGFLSAAASNAASIEDTALRAGRKEGGAAKGELILAIFELANSFRHGWGVKKDPVAAKQYYETAANLGDTDAMNEVGWCYLEGFGCKKDKLAAAKYYRLAEKGGSKILGNGWIWKEKYNPKE